MVCPLLPRGCNPVIHICLMDRHLTYFASDVHLGLDVKGPEEREKRFVSFLKGIPAAQTEALYLLGDIWDFWYEYRDVVPKGYLRVLSALQDLMDGGVKVYFFQGNHDVWTYSYFESLGMIPLVQPHLAVIGGKLFCLGHGAHALGVTRVPPPAPVKCSTASVNVLTPYTRMPATNAPSSAFSEGRRIAEKPASFAAITQGNTPGTARTLPSKPSSPRIPYPAVRSSGRNPRAQRIPRAMARSYPVPPFRSSAGERFTVMRFAGTGYPEFFRATRTRSLASFTSPARYPTMSKQGRPLPTSTSVLMTAASMPVTEKLYNEQNMVPSPSLIRKTSIRETKGKNHSHFTKKCGPPFDAGSRNSVFFRFFHRQYDEITPAFL